MKHCITDGVGGGRVFLCCKSRRAETNVRFLQRVKTRASFRSGVKAVLMAGHEGEEEGLAELTKANE